MEQLFTDSLLQVAAAVLSVVVAYVVATLSKAKKAVYESERVRQYAGAVKIFDEDLYAALAQTARAAVAKADDISDELSHGDEFAWAYERVTDYVNRTAEATGVRVRFTEDHLQSLVRGALEQARR